MQSLDGGRQIDDAHHCGREVAHGDDLRIGLVLEIGLDGGIGLQRGAAGQRHAVLAFHVHQRERIGRAVVHLAVANLDLAGAAQAVAAGVGNVNTLAQSGVQQGLAFLHFNRGAQGF